MNSEILNKFDESRIEFKPYGLTCELWSPNLMSRPDRHNEIELNYFPEGSITYLLQREKVTIPSNRLALFWGLIPHQIIKHNGNTPYYVCTIPFSLFLEWNLPSTFVDKVLKGELLLESTEDFSVYDEFLLSNWVSDIKKKEAEDVILVEAQARLTRFAHNSISKENNSSFTIPSSEIGHVEKIAMYIAQNHHKPITVFDIGKKVGLHPDYANSIFRKAFGNTLSEQIMKERIARVQRKLVTTDTNISTIAYECGFNSISSFNSIFKKLNGCTPREFRNRI